MIVSSLSDLFRHPIESYPRHDAFREKRDGRWVDISSDAFVEDVAALGEGLVELGLAPGDRVAILSENRYLWAVADMAAITRGGVVVPIYATLPPSQVAQILRMSGARWVFASNAAQLAKLAEAIDPGIELGAIVVFNAGAAPSNAFPCLFLDYDTLRARGATAFARRGIAPMDVAGPRDPEEVVTLIYTSGTTGEPKGVMLTHTNIISNVSGALERFPITRADAVLSFLPLTHIFERVAGFYTMYVAGASIAYAQSTDTVAADALDTRPTILLGVPRFFEKLHARVERSVASQPPLRRRLFAAALGVGMRRAEVELGIAPTRKGFPLALPLAERLVFRKIHQRIGGRVRFFVSGSAPLQPELIRYFFAIGIPVYEGYGLTEASPVITANSPGAVRLGSVGRTFPNVRVRIAADGEVEARGPNTTRGYFRNPAATEALYTPDGWMRTGDLGRVDEHGFLYITGRKKELIVTAGGKKVAPQPIEIALCRNRFVADAMLIGDTRKFISAILLPEFTALREVATEKGLAVSEPAALAAHPEMRALFQGIVDDVNAGLARFEAIKKFVILPFEASVADGSLTPSLKLKRRVIEERFRAEIEALYEDPS